MLFIFRDRLRDHLLTLQNYETSKTALERKEAELNKQISELRVEVIELQENIVRHGFYMGDFPLRHDGYTFLFFINLRNILKYRRSSVSITEYE